MNHARRSVVLLGGLLVIVTLLVAFDGVVSGAASAAAFLGLFSLLIKLVDVVPDDA